LHLLEAYYAALVQSDGGSGFVAETMGPVSARNGAVVGYVCGVWESAAVRSILLGAQWPRLVFWISAQVLVRPRLVVELVGQWRTATKRPPTARQAYELRPIVVDAAMRRKGIGAQLVEALLADAFQRGFRQVHLFAEADNAAANAFYREIGFRCAGSENRRGAATLRYEYTLSGCALSGP
jgi:ribosomal protein S18 acetylase RimI-like enzyme